MTVQHNKLLIGKIEIERCHHFLSFFCRPHTVQQRKMFQEFFFLLDTHNIIIRYRWSFRPIFIVIIMTRYLIAFLCAPDIELSIFCRDRDIAFNREDFLQIIQENPYRSIFVYAGIRINGCIINHISCRKINRVSVRCNLHSFQGAKRCSFRNDATDPVNQCFKIFSVHLKFHLCSS